MSAAAATSQPGNKRQRSSEGQDTQLQAGSRGGAGSGPSAASLPPQRFMCVSDSFRSSGVTACTKAVYSLLGAKKKAVGLKQGVATLEKCLAEGTVPRTLKVQLPQSFGSNGESVTPAVTAFVSALEVELLKESLKVKREKQAHYEQEIADPLATFEREYKELVCFSKLPPDLAAKATEVGKDQSSVFNFEWIKATAAIAAKVEQAEAARTAAAEKAAQSEMELSALPSGELIKDLVAKQVAADLRARDKAAKAQAAAKSGNAGKAKAQAKAQASSTQGGTSGGGKGKQTPKHQAKAPKNAQRK